MVREVRITKTEPLRIDESDIDPKYGDIAICQCGLSDDRPFCDGSHKRTDNEMEGVIYRYTETDRKVVESLTLTEEEI